MQVWFDTEFSNIDKINAVPMLISIGCIAQDGREFYAELSDTWHPAKKPRQADSSGAFAAWNNSELAEYDGALVRCESGESGEPGESVVFFPRTSN